MAMVRETTELILMKFRIKHYIMVIQDLAKRAMIQIQDGRHAHIWWKQLKGLLLQNHWVDLADILHAAYGASADIK